MNSYNLQYTGPSVDSLLNKAQVAVITDEYYYSEDQQARARENIAAASAYTEEVTIPSLWSAIATNSLGISTLDSNIISTSNEIDSLDNRTANASIWDLLLSQTDTTDAIQLEITLEQYSTLASYLSDVYDPNRSYIQGYFARNPSDVANCYECIASITTGNWNSSDWRKISVTSD